MRDNAALQNVTDIQLLEYPIPPRPRPSSSSHKPTPGDISQTEQAIIDPLVSKGPENIARGTTDPEIDSETWT